MYWFQRKIFSSVFFLNNVLICFVQNHNGWSWNESLGYSQRLLQRSSCLSFYRVIIHKLYVHAAYVLCMVAYKLHKLLVELSSFHAFLFTISLFFFPVDPKFLYILSKISSISSSSVSEQKSILLLKTNLHLHIYKHSTHSKSKSSFVHSNVCFVKMHQLSTPKLWIAI